MSSKTALAALALSWCLPAAASAWNDTDQDGIDDII